MKKIIFILATLTLSLVANHEQHLVEQEQTVLIFDIEPDEPKNEPLVIEQETWLGNFTNLVIGTLVCYFKDWIF